MLQGHDGVMRQFTLQSMTETTAATATATGQSLPRAHTCFNRLDLPLDQSQQQLEQILMQVVQWDIITGFDMD